MRKYDKYTDAELARINWAVEDLEEWPEEELKRVLWMGASGQIFLPQPIGNAIDEEIRMKPLREAKRRAFWDEDEEFETEMGL